MAGGTGALPDEERFPFVVGVVGHRDLVPDDEPTIRPEVAGFLEELGRRVPSASIEIVTGLAAGADLLVAEVAHDLEMPVLGVLPMPWEMYRRDFGDDDLARVERLLAADGVDFVVIPPPSDLDLDAARADGVDRDRLYDGLRRHLEASSHVLLALWDGVANGLPGGTGDVVLSYLGARTPDLTTGPVAFDDEPSDDDHAGDVVAWIPVRRSDGERPDETTIRFLTPGIQPSVPSVSDQFPRSLQLRLEALEDHLQDATHLANRELTVGATSLLKGIDDEELIRSLGPLVAEFERADRLAVAHQVRSENVFKAMAFAAGAMGLVFLLYAKVEALEIYLFAYLGFAFAGYALFLIARRRDWFTRHLADRVVAESLRVRFHLSLTGVDSDVHTERLMGLLGITGLRGFAWVRDAWRVGPRPIQTGTNDAAITAVRRDWVDDQAAYFRARLASLHRRQERLERVRAALFGLSLIAGVALILFAHDLAEVEMTSNVNGKTAVLVLMGLLPLWLGIWELYQNKMAMRELIWQYSNQAAHFSTASRALARPLSPAEQRGVLADLGERALFDVYLWSLHRFHREAEPSLPG